MKYARAWHGLTFVVAAGAVILQALRLDAVVILFGGGLVHFFLLRPLLDLSGADLIADRLLHIVVPLLVAIGWVAFGPRNRIDSGDLGRFLIVPLVWIVYTLIRGAIVDWYPYPFVDVNEHGYLTVVLTALAIGGVLVVLALLCRWADRLLPAR